MRKIITVIFFVGTCFFAYLVLIIIFGMLASSPPRPEHPSPTKKAIAKKEAPNSIEEIGREEDKGVISYHKEVEGKRWGIGISFHADPYEVGEFVVTHGYLMYVLSGEKVTEALYAASPIDFDIGFKLPISKNKNLIFTLPVAKISLPLLDVEDKENIVNNNKEKNL